MKGRVVQTGAAHAALKNDLLGVMRKHGGDVSAIEMLAIAARIVGQMTAMQDQRRYSSEAVMETVARNIEAGNREFIESFAAEPPAGRA